MKSIVYNIKNLTDTQDYDHDNHIFKGLINYNEMGKINNEYYKGSFILIQTHLDMEDTSNFLKIWGVNYSKIIDISVNKAATDKVLSICTDLKIPPTALEILDERYTVFLNN